MPKNDKTKMSARDLKRAQHKQQKKANKKEEQEVWGFVREAKALGASKEIIEAKVFVPVPIAIFDEVEEPGPNGFLLTQTGFLKIDARKLSRVVNEEKELSHNPVETGKTEIWHSLTVPGFTYDANTKKAEAKAVAKLSQSESDQSESHQDYSVSLKEELNSKCFFVPIFLKVLKTDITQNLYSIFFILGRFKLQFSYTRKFKVGENLTPKDVKSIEPVTKEAWNLIYGDKITYEEVQALRKKLKDQAELSRQDRIQRKNLKAIPNYLQVLKDISKMEKELRPLVQKQMVALLKVMLALMYPADQGWVVTPTKNNQVHFSHNTRKKLPSFFEDPNNPDAILYDENWYLHCNRQQLLLLEKTYYHLFYQHEQRVTKQACAHQSLLALGIFGKEGAYHKALDLIKEYNNYDIEDPYQNDDATTPASP